MVRVVRRAVPTALPVMAAVLALTGCAAAPDQGGNTGSLWWFASLALAGLAIAAYALGRLSERKVRGPELFEARSRHAALLSVVQDTVWRTDTQQAWLQRTDLPSAALVAGARAAHPMPAPAATPPDWFKHPDLQALLVARRAFQDLQLQPQVLSTEASTEASTEPSTEASTECTAWLLCGQPLLDHEGRFAGFLGTARALPAHSSRAARAMDGSTQSAAAAVPEPTATASSTANAAALPAPSPAATMAATMATSAAATAATTAAASAPATLADSEEANNFSLTVAHDLRAPIRVVDGFTRIVKEDYGHLLDRVANDHLERVLSAAARMNKMIDALLTLARLSNQPLTRQPVNLSRLAHHVVDELQRAQPGRDVDISIEPDLQVTGDPTLLRLVLENLLGNAWKYSGRTPKAQISLGAVRLGRGRAFVVRDNGAGFDMRSAERLFGVFQRLHSASEFPGHGVGLASTRRIVRRHGGDIWAEAEPARGATFTFTLDEG